MPVVFWYRHGLLVHPRSKSTGKSKRIARNDHLPSLLHHVLVIRIGNVLSIGPISEITKNRTIDFGHKSMHASIARHKLADPAAMIAAEHFVMVTPDLVAAVTPGRSNVESVGSEANG